MLRKVKVMLAAALPTIVLVSVSCLLLWLTIDNRERSRTNATYLRFNACSLNIPPSQRAGSDIDRCWDAAEQATGVNVPHFGK